MRRQGLASASRRASEALRETCTTRRRHLLFAPQLSANKFWIDTGCTALPRTCPQVFFHTPSAHFVRTTRALAVIVLTTVGGVAAQVAYLEAVASSIFRVVPERRPRSPGLRRVRGRRQSRRLFPPRRRRARPDGHPARHPAGGDRRSGPHRALREGGEGGLLCGDDWRGRVSGDDQRHREHPRRLAGHCRPGPSAAVGGGSARAPRDVVGRSLRLSRPPRCGRFSPSSTSVIGQLRGGSE